MDKDEGEEKEEDGEVEECNEGEGRGLKTKREASRIQTGTNKRAKRPTSALQIILTFCIRVVFLPAHTPPILFISFASSSKFTQASFFAPVTLVSCRFQSSTSRRAALMVIVPSPQARHFTLASSRSCE